jgi:hypothetical protein
VTSKQIVWDEVESTRSSINVSCMYYLEEVKTENMEGVSSWACAEGVQDEMSSRLLNTKQEIF